MSCTCTGGMRVAVWTLKWEKRASETARRGPRVQCKAVRSRGHEYGTNCSASGKADTTVNTHDN